MAEPLEPMPAPWAALLRTWGRLWGLDGLEHRITLRESGRLTRTLGRCQPGTGLITLRAGLPPDQVPAILCHEAAHVAAYLLHGPGLRPHGPQWAALVAQAGFRPAVEYAGPAPCLPGRLSTPPGSFRFAHRCPVCQATRWARRPVRGWRCADCLAQGLSGAMEIIDTRTPAIPR